MAVVSCGLKPWKGRSSHLRVEVGGKSINAIQRTIVEAYQILTNNPADTAVIVTSSPLVPQLMYSVHPDYPLAVCTDLSVTQPSGSPCDWLGLATFTTLQPQQGQDNPLARPDIVRWSPLPRQQVLELARYGGIINAKFEQQNYTGPFPPLEIGELVGVMNAAGDLFDPPVMDDTFDMCATVTRNVAFVPEFLLDYASYPASVNNAPLMFGGILMNTATLKILAPSVSELKTENMVQYYTLDMKFAYRRIGWDWRIPNQGYNQVLPNGTKQPIALKGVNAMTPQQLDQNGAYIGPDPTKTTWCVFQRPRDDFSIIRLPPT